MHEHDYEEDNPAIQITCLFRHESRYIPELNRLLPQLTARFDPIDDDHFFALTNDESNPLSNQARVAVFIIKDSRTGKSESEFLGTATAVFYPIPTGWAGRIEDVIVDETFRQQSFGRRLTKHTFGFFQNEADKRRKTVKVTLNSSPNRELANAMYLKYGFELLATAVPEIDPTTGKQAVDPKTGKPKWKGTNFYGKSFHPSI